MLTIILEIYDCARWGQPLVLTEHRKGTNLTNGMAETVASRVHAFCFLPFVPICAPVFHVLPNFFEWKAWQLKGLLSNNAAISL